MKTAALLDDQISLQIKDKYLLSITGSDGKKESMELFIRDGKYYTRPAFCPAAEIPRQIAQEMIDRYNIKIGTEERIFNIETKADISDFCRKYWHRDRCTDEIFTSDNT